MYSLEDIDKAFDQLGIQKGDNLYCHANLGLSGTLYNCRSSNELAQIYYTKIRNRIGNNGTLVFPSYTYSFCTNDSFDLNNTPSKMGILSEYARTSLNISRTKDPSKVRSH